MPSALPYILASVFLVPGILALLIRDPRRSRVIGFGGGAVASFLGLVVTLAGSMRGGPMRIPLPAPVPWATSELFIDGLSAFFLVLVFFIGFLVSVYAVGYMKEFDARRRGQAAPLLLNLLLLSMVFVVSAGDMLSFLLGWEVMSLASYFLVVLDHEKREARQAGLIYLIATHIGTGGSSFRSCSSCRRPDRSPSTGSPPFPSRIRRSSSPRSGSPCWGSARRRGSFRSTSGCHTPTLKPRRQFPPSCPAS